MPFSFMLEDIMDFLMQSSAFKLVKRFYNWPLLVMLGCDSLFWPAFIPLPGEGNGNPLEYSRLENPVDRGTWWAAVHGVTQSRTRLKRLSMHACNREGNGNPLQYSCLESPRGRGAWWAAVYGVAQSRTRLI